VAHTLTARLVVLQPHAGGQSQVALDRNRILVGRDPRSDLFLDDPVVSWRHAEVSRSDGRWMVQDLGSSNGTALGPRPVTNPAEIRDGDVLVLGNIRVRLEDPQSTQFGGPPTATLPPAGPTPSGVRERGPEARFSIGDQWARGTINNVEGSQNNYVHQILQQRESFSARWLPREPRRAGSSGWA
jgi:hypothetical protein